MNRIKLSIVALVLTSTGMFAQTISDAIKLTTNEQFEKADAMFTTLIQGQPNNGEYLFYAGENQGCFHLSPIFCAPFLTY